MYIVSLAVSIEVRYSQCTDWLVVSGRVDTSIDIVEMIFHGVCALSGKEVVLAT